jgi:hypothetical protein
MMARMWKGTVRLADADAIKAFAGEDIDAAVYYPEDERYLVERDATVLHYEVADHLPGQAGPVAG